MPLRHTVYSLLVFTLPACLLYQYLHAATKIHLWYPIIMQTSSAAGDFSISMITALNCFVLLATLLRFHNACDNECNTTVNCLLYFIIIICSNCLMLK